MEDLYKKFGLDMDDESSGNHITYEFEELFNNYQDMSGFGHVVFILIGFLFLFVAFIFLLSFMITYLCHFKRRSCCKCKKTCSYISIIAAMILSFPNFIYAYYSKTKINLTKEEIYQFDHDFNQRTEKNINFMKIRKIILISGVYILYAIYIVHIILLCLFNKKLIIVDDNTNKDIEVNNVNINDANNAANVNNVVNVNNNNNVAYNPLQALPTNENRISEK